MSNCKSTYPLLPYSQLVFEATRWMPSVYNFPSLLRWRGGAVQKERIENAIRKALNNHPVFASRVDWRGQQNGGIPKDVLHGQYHDIDLEIKGEDLYLRLFGSRILGDGKSGEILAEDIYRAFNGLPLKPDDYWGYVARWEQRKTEPHYSASRDWLIREFADASAPVRPTIDRKWLFTLLPPKAGLYMDDYSSLHDRLDRLKEESFLSYEGIFSLCTALAIAEYCGTDEAALTWAYEGRETPEEQRIVGSLHRDIPFRISRKSKVKSQKIASREECIKEARNQIRSGIAHSDYPYTLTAPYNKRWNYAVNVLRFNDTEELLPMSGLPIEIVSVPEQKYAYALLDVEIHEHPQDLSLWFRYSATHYQESSIHRFASLVRKYVEWLVE